MAPKARCSYLSAAARFAAESSTGTNASVGTIVESTKSVDALVYYIDPENEIMKIAYPCLRFDRNLAEGRAMVRSFSMLSIGNNRVMRKVEHGIGIDIYLPPSFLRLLAGPSCNIVSVWSILGNNMPLGGLRGFQPRLSGVACFGLWQGGFLLKDYRPRGNPVYCQENACTPEVALAMQTRFRGSGKARIFSSGIAAADPVGMVARGKYAQSQFVPPAHA